MDHAANRSTESVLRQGIVCDPCDRVIFATRDVVAGEFRCPTSYAGFATAGRINHYIVAFPRSAVWIEREDGPRFVADPGTSTIYNPGDPYLRMPISPEGDLSDWLGVSDRLARGVVRRFDPRDAERHAPFRQPRAQVSSATYLAQRTLFSALTDGPVDDLDIEERALDIMVDVIRAAYAGEATASLASLPRHGRPRRDLVEDAKAAILADLFENLSVCELAERVHVSPFHLCRVFRAETNLTLHAYRREIRLRAALGLTDSYRGNLSALALHAGFYSHSHFTTAFRHAFGQSPSTAASSM